MEKTKER